jgi:hypothetical protein
MTDDAHDVGLMTLLINGVAHGLAVDLRQRAMYQSVSLILGAQPR